MQYAVIEGISFGILDGFNSILKLIMIFTIKFLLLEVVQKALLVRIIKTLLNKNLCM